jgi:hypothetical protein
LVGGGGGGEWEILRDNRRRRNFKKLDLEYLVFLGHDIVDSIVVAGYPVIVLSHHVLADEQFLRAGLVLARTTSAVVQKGKICQRIDFIAWQWC